MVTGQLSKSVKLSNNYAVQDHSLIITQQTEELSQITTYYCFITVMTIDDEQNNAGN